MRLFPVAALLAVCAGCSAERPAPPTEGPGRLSILRAAVRLAPAPSAPTAARLQVVAASSADGAVELVAGGSRLRVRARGLGPGTRLADPSATLHLSAQPDVDVAHVVRPDLFEEIRVLHRAAGAYEAVYEIDATGVDEVRAREGWVEAVVGARVVLSCAPAWARDRSGVQTWASVTVERADDRYLARYRYELTGLTPPIVLDPAWSTVASMKEGRRGAVGMLLGDGRVLVVGGFGASGGLSSAEAYTPSTNTWASETAAPLAAPSAGLLTPGGALFSFGYSSYVYDVAGKTWTSKPLSGGSLALAGGKLVLVTDSAARVADPTSLALLATVPVPAGFPNQAFRIAEAGGKVWVPGGTDGSGRTLSSVFVFDPATSTWSKAADLPGKRASERAVRHPSGKVVLLDGTDEASAPQASPWILDPASGTWTIGAAGVFTYPSSFGLDGAGRVLTYNAFDLTKVQVFDLARGLWLSAPDLPSGHENGTSVVLADGRTLIVGGGDVIGGASATNAVALFGPLANGVACDGGAGGCASGHCVGGVCCDAACTGPCQACDVAGKVGTCSPISGTPVASCGAYAKCVAGACATSCTTSTDCATTAFCSGGACVPKLELAAACTVGSSCKSGNCVDGVCCDTSCGGVCEACKLVGREGTCSPVKGPPAFGRPACTGTGAGTPCGPVCDGVTTSTCSYLKAGTTPCGAATCDATTGVETHLATCNGAGACGDVAKTCGAYACGPTACKSACGSKADCAAGFNCSASACVPVTGLGKACASSEACATGHCTDGVCCATGSCGAGSSCAQPGHEGTCVKLAGIACTADGQCGSGICVDGVCCDARCDGQCEACDVPGQVGKCAPVVGAPRGARTACTAGTKDAPCAAKSCDGTDRKGCARFAGAEVVCRAATCDGSELLPEAVCDEAGACALKKTSCGAYRCDDAAKACKVACADDGDCATGNHCRDRRCRPVASTCGADGRSVLLPDGSSKACDPYVCKGGECASACGASTDCTPGNACDERGVCVPVGGAADAGGGCSTGAARTGGPSLWWFALGAVLLGRRRRAAAGVALAVASAGCRASTAAPPDDREQHALRALEALGDPRLGHTSEPQLPTDLDVHGDGSGSAPLSLARDGVSFTVEAHDLATARSVVARGVRVFADLHGADVFVATSAGGAEELRRLPVLPASYRVTYRVRAPGMRLSVAGRELHGVTPEGRRYLLMTAPFAADAHGVRRDLDVTFEPGDDGGDVTVSLDTAGLAAPVVVDPTWTLLSELGFVHTLQRLFAQPGGNAFIYKWTSSSEAWSKATGTWSVVADPPSANIGVNEGALADGRVVLAGSGNGSLETWIRDPATGTWTAGGNLPAARTEARVALLDNGRLLLAGGRTNTSTSDYRKETFLFDGTTKAWTAAGSTNSAANTTRLAALPGAKALFVSSLVSGPSAETWAAGTWTSTAAPSLASVGELVSLTDGRVLLTGQNGGVAVAQVFDPTTGTWSAAAAPKLTDGYAALVRLGNGRVLAVGASTTSSAEVWDPATDTWSFAGRLRTKRSGVSAALLSDGRVMVTAGFYVPAGWAYDTEIFAQLANGAACEGAGECQSGFCADGVCCDKACAGACQACNLATKVGTCSPVDGTPAKGHPACAPYAACVAGSCAASCTSDAQCCGSAAACCKDAVCSPGFAGAYCDATKCVDKKAAGAACAAARECQSGFCVDGVCCDSKCDGACEACAEAATKGTCTAVTGAPRAGHPGCVATGGAPVGTDCGLACQGVNRKACELAAAGAPCSKDACALGVETHASSCDGVGACSDVKKSCGAFACGATKCNGKCSASTDCAAGFNCSATGTCLPAPGLGLPCDATTVCAGALTCVDGVCCGSASCSADESCATALKKGSCAKKDGVACASDGDCGSGACVDGVCCEGRCAGQCQACDVPGSVGKCSPVKGAPHGARVPCAKGASACETAACDGSDGSRCAALAGAETSCRVGACEAGVEIAAASCDGKGGCPAEVKRACAPYLCAADGKACAKACATDAECAPGNRCAAGVCTKADKVCSDDGLAVVDADGKRSTCAPLRCKDSACLTKCSSSDDCIVGMACSDGACISATAPAATDGGGCSHRGSSRGEGLVLVFSTLLGVLGARSRARPR